MCTVGCTASWLWGSIISCVALRVACMDCAAFHVLLPCDLCSVHLRAAPVPNNRSQPLEAPPRAVACMVRHAVIMLCILHAPKFEDRSFTSRRKRRTYGSMLALPVLDT
jgi:hypothetical protein